MIFLFLKIFSLACSPSSSRIGRFRGDDGVQTSEFGILRVLLSIMSQVNFVNFFLVLLISISVCFMFEAMLAKDGTHETASLKSF